MLVAFWGPVHGQVRTTSNMVAIATTIALDHHVRILMTHTHFERSTLEKAYTKLRHVNSPTLGAIGMDAIERLVQCGMLTPEGIRDNAESIIKDRLDIISGPMNQEIAGFRKVLPHIFDSYKRFYELLFIDVSSGTRNELSSLVMKHADLIVVNVNQNKSVLDPFFAKEEWLSVLDEKPIVYCIGSYERNSKLTRSRMAKLYGIPKKRIGYVPHNVRYMDAQNDQHIIDYLLRARMVEKKFLEFNDEVYFTQSVRNMGDCILDALDMYFVAEDDVRD
ncbi:hypothetical protein K0T92_10660 [Paenibacillus oenotherae]|uniref:AAA domain-containing protein n=1 Tax=Paenibacillus oenotherae TaxID=1435645 RepID=A0ABS7D5T8_9BACL|nr:hypothetical protein [Paenibacillus oenotherae]MBW7475209.1 hypothetical protein [Paenibacillus oenotherae]